MRSRSRVVARMRGLVVAVGLLGAFAAAAPVAQAATSQGVVPLATSVTGGDPIYGGGVRCSTGVNVTSGGAYYFVTSGQCGQIVSTWYSDPAETTQIGVTVGSSFPGDDSAVVRYLPGIAHPGTVGKQDVTSAGAPVAGEHVCMRGGASGVVCGAVTAMNVSVSYPGGTVSGLIQTNICSGPGDIGGALYDGTTVLGILSGADQSGCSSYFQPITEILARYGLSIY